MAFAASAERLLQSGHVKSAQIGQQKEEILRGHQRVLQRTEQRRLDLERALALEGLRREADELARWMGEKGRVMEQQQGGGAGGNGWLHSAQTRYQAFVLELAVNQAELSRLKKACLRQKKSLTIISA